MQKKGRCTLILFSPSNLKLCKASFATVALTSSIYSTNAMSFFVGMRRTSYKLGYLSCRMQKCKQIEEKYVNSNATVKTGRWVVPSWHFREGFEGKESCSGEGIRPAFGHWVVSLLARLLHRPLQKKSKIRDCSGRRVRNGGSILSAASRFALYFAFRGLVYRVRSEIRS